MLFTISIFMYIIQHIIIMFASFIRSIVSTYIIAREWDMKHFDLTSKASRIFSSLFSKFEQFDEKYGIQQVVASLIERLQSFDKKNHITQKSKILLKTVDEKYGVSEYVNKISSMEKVQIISKSINATVSSTMASVGEISQEIKSFEEKQKMNAEEADVQTANNDKEKAE